MAEISEADRIKTVRTFHDQVMAAVLDGKELAFWELLENFFQKNAQKNYDLGFASGWNSALITAAEMGKE